MSYGSGADIGDSVVSDVPNVASDVSSLPADIPTDVPFTGPVNEPNLASGSAASLPSDANPVGGWKAPPSTWSKLSPYLSAGLGMVNPTAGKAFGLINGLATGPGPTAQPTTAGNQNAINTAMQEANAGPAPNPNTQEAAMTPVPKMASTTPPTDNGAGIIGDVLAIAALL